jgi:glutamyl-tRNA(Gln) amidotransferase subunit E
MMPLIVEYPKMDFESILLELNFKKVEEKEILEQLPVLIDKFNEESDNPTDLKRKNWVMGQIRQLALGNMNLTELSKRI